MVEKIENLYTKKRIGLKFDIIEKAMSNFNLPFIAKKGFCLLRRTLDYNHHKEYAKHYKKLNELYNLHKGERCFVVGMGPSLDKTRFDLIKDEHFIVSNNFYQGMNKFHINPEYWCVADDAVFDIHYKNLLTQDTTMFLTEDASRIFLENKEYYMNGLTVEPIVVKPLGNLTTWKKISKNLRYGAYGGMVINSSLQIAFHLGFKDIYLIGCDCDASAGTHFEGADTFNVHGIVNENDKWDSAFNSYKVFKDLFKKENRTIYNATVGGKLEMFERRRLEDIG